jgi:hypothetical protein
LLNLINESIKFNIIKCKSIITTVIKIVIIVGNLIALTLIIIIKAKRNIIT